MICILVAIVVFLAGMSMDKLTRSNQKNEVVEKTEKETKKKKI